MQLPWYLPVSGTMGVLAPADDRQDSRCTCSKTGTHPRKCLLPGSPLWAPQAHWAPWLRPTSSTLHHICNFSQGREEAEITGGLTLSVSCCCGITALCHPIANILNAIVSYILSFFLVLAKGINLLLVTPSWSKMLHLHIVLASYCGCNNLPQSSYLKQHKWIIFQFGRCW